MFAAPTAAPARLRRHHLPLTFMHRMLALGMPGLLFVSAVDSSPIPLPIPGSTDILLILLAARSGHWLLLILIATAGSAIGGYSSYKTGRVGGVLALQRYVPTRYLTSLTSWTERHSFVAVALPAILPPPMPLTPFLLAAGALKMNLRTFMGSYVGSRALRHSFTAWLGIHYGRAIVRTWNRFYARYNGEMLEILCVVIALTIAVPIIILWKQSRQSKLAGIPA
jgi:membrane protein YqaA with SNARE-associated domain